MNSLIVGICGGTGSGKSTLSRRLAAAFPKESTILEMDCYYSNFPELTYEQRTKLNYDCPDAFDRELLVEQLLALRRGESVQIPQYDFTKHLRAENTKLLESKPLIILEGILLFACPELMELLDMKIFVDADADVRILRRAKRDVQKRGRTLESVMEQYVTTVKPMHALYVEPYKTMADIIVPNGGKNENALEMITCAVAKRLRENG